MNDDINKTPILVLLKDIHQELSHPGSTKMYETFKKLIKIKNFKKLIALTTENCLCYAKQKDPSVKYGKVAGGLSEEQPQKFISIDIFGLIKSKHFNTTFSQDLIYIIAFADVASRFCEVKTLSNISTKEILKALVNCWIKKYGNPTKILTD